MQASGTCSWWPLLDAFLCHQKSLRPIGSFLACRQLAKRHFLPPSSSCKSAVRSCKLQAASRNLQLASRTQSRLVLWGPPIRSVLGACLFLSFQIATGANQVVLIATRRVNLGLSLAGWLAGHSKRLRAKWAARRRAGAAPCGQAAALLALAAPKWITHCALSLSAD